ncbi:MAG: 30S ribosomal protein S6 [Planctomycetes bacterium]|nr:30S ribosomal protein S6 [Planctomycetota bacterium]
MANKTAVYEGMFILDANRLARDREGLPRELASAIEEAGGQMELSQLWEERRLAYPIKGQRKGAYWITYFRLPTTNLADLTRQLELKEGILRHLFIRLPDSLVKPILEHAKGEPAQADQPEEKGEEGKDDKASVVEAVEATAS